MKAVAALLAPFLFIFLLTLYSLVTNLLNGIDNPIASFIFTNDTYAYILLIYLITSGCYLILAAPTSVLIERYQRSLKGLSYSIAGIIGGYLFLSVLGSLNQTPANLSIEATLLFAGAGMGYYVVLCALKRLSRVKRKEFS